MFTGAAQQSVLDALQFRASATACEPALFRENRSPLCCGEFWAETTTIADALYDGGIQRGDVVAVALPDGPELIASFVGASRVAACAPLNIALHLSELTAFLCELRPRVLISDCVDGVIADAARSQGISVLDTKSGHLVHGDGGASTPVVGGEVALLLQTSATTGRPKIVPLSRGNLTAMAWNTVRSLQLTAADRFLSLMPLCHLQGLLSALAQMMCGGAVMATAGFDAGAFPRWMKEFRPSWFTAGPVLHRTIVALLKQRNECAPEGLRFVRSIGAAMPLELRGEVEEALGAPVVEGYGLTEAGAVTSNALPPGARKPGSAGRSTGAEVSIIDDVGVPLPAGVEGEIAVRGACVTSGYLNDPEANRRAFAGGWLRTGDVGRLDADGFLFVTGRIKDIINRGGEKIQPQEIEGALQAHPAVLEAAAFGMPHPTLGEDVGAAVVLRPGEAVSEHALRRFVTTRLAQFKTPRRIFFVAEIAKGTTGKPQRAVLAAEMAARVEPARAAADAVERRLIEIWKRVLNVEDAGVHDDFFRIGGDSLALALMLAEVETDFGVARRLLEDPDFFASPEIATLAGILAESGSTPPGSHAAVIPVVALQPHGQRTPFFCFPGADENPYYFRHLAQGLAPDQPFYAVRDPRPIEQRGAYTVEEAAREYVNIITAAQKGPYILGGHCYGGIVAFEVARQLAARGEDVRQVILFEVPAPGYPKVLRHWKDYGRQAARAMRGGSGVGVADVRAHLNVLGPLLRRKAATMRRRILMRAKLKSVVEPLERVEHPNVQAGRSYAPKELACNVVQFLAADEVHSALILDDSRLAWREFTRGEFTVCRTAGKATEIFKPPHVRELAARVRAVLEGTNTEAAQVGGGM